MIFAVPAKDWLPPMSDIPTKTAYSLADLTEIERQAHRLRAAAVADMMRALTRGIARLIGRLTHHHGTPAHG